MYVDPKRNQQAGNLAWILPYCKPDLPRVAGAVVLFCVNNTMALIIPLLSGLIVDRVITQGHVDELTRLCVMMLVLHRGACRLPLRLPNVDGTLRTELHISPRQRRIRKTPRT